MAKLLLEINEEISIIKESKEDGSRKFFIEGVMLQGNLKNRNGRVYPTEILAKEVKNYTENYINKKRSFGELNHPPNPSINLDRVSHMITEIRQDGNNFIGRAKIMETPMGKIVQAIMEDDGVLGVSSRGLGSLKESREGKIVQSDFTLTTAADIVSDPSAPDAFVENIIENVDWIFNGVEWTRQEKAYEAVQKFKQESKALREEKFLELFKKLF